MSINSDKLMQQIRSAAAAEPLANILMVLVEALDADHGAILTALGIQLQYPKEQGAFAFSRLVVDHVLDTGKPLISKDLTADEAATSSQSLKMHGIRTVLCTPFRLPAGDDALFYVDSTRRSYTKEHLQVVIEVLDQALEPLQVEVRALADEPEG